MNIIENGVIRAMTASELSRLAADQAFADAQTVKRNTDRIREVRNAKLLETDWTQIPNSGLEQASIDAFAAYRQLLRDLPETITDWSVEPVWPAEPDL